MVALPVVVASYPGVTVTRANSLNGIGRWIRHGRHRRNNSLSLHGWCGKHSGRPGGSRLNNDFFSACR